MGGVPYLGLKQWGWADIQAVNICVLLSAGRGANSARHRGLSTLYQYCAAALLHLVVWKTPYLQCAMWASFQISVRKSSVGWADNPLLRETTVIYSTQEVIKEV